MPDEREGFPTDRPFFEGLGPLIQDLLLTYKSSGRGAFYRPSRIATRDGLQKTRASEGWKDVRRDAARLMERNCSRDEESQPVRCAADSSGAPARPRISENRPPEPLWVTEVRARASAADTVDSELPWISRLLTGCWYNDDVCVAFISLLKDESATRNIHIADTYFLAMFAARTAAVRHRLEKTSAESETCYERLPSAFFSTL